MKMEGKQTVFLSRHTRLCQRSAVMSYSRTKQRLMPSARRSKRYKLGKRKGRALVLTKAAKCERSTASGREHLNGFGQRQASKKRRKSRTAFTNHQIYELEKRFLYQKYLSPADRDQIAQQLGLTNAQVITWFQNRRAKLKRDLEEMKADVESLKKIPPQALEKLVSMDDIDDPHGGSGPISPSLSPRAFPQSPSSSRGQTTDEFSEEDEEIEVDD